MKKEGEKNHHNNNKKFKLQLKSTLHIFSRGCKQTLVPGLMTARWEECSDGENRRRARKALMLSCWAFNEVEPLPGLFPQAVVPAKPRYLALALCPVQGTVSPNDWANKRKIKAKHLVPCSLPLLRNPNVSPSVAALALVLGAALVMRAKNQIAMKDFRVESKNTGPL